MNGMNELLCHLQMKHPLLVVLTNEEERYFNKICGLNSEKTGDLNSDVISWKGDAFEHIVDNGNINKNQNIENAIFSKNATQFLKCAAGGIFALRYIERNEGNEYTIKNEASHILFILMDFHHYWHNPQIKRKLKDIAMRRDKNYSILILTSDDKIPHELKDECAIFDGSLPDINDLRVFLDGHIGEAKKVPGLTVHDKIIDRKKLSSAALGLTQNSAELAFRASCLELGGIKLESINSIIDHKKQLVRDVKFLEHYPVMKIEDVFGGYKNIKKWLLEHRTAYGEAGVEYGLEYPKPLLIFGPPGVGKSYCIKMLCGNMYSLPLLRLDISAIFGSGLGQSERNLMTAISIASNVKPAILWIDEFEKSLVPEQNSECDGGCSQRIYASFLTWIEQQQGLLVMATVNDISKISLEMLRRFVVFFMDLPNHSEREDITSIILQKHGIPREILDENEFQKIVELTDGYTAADIESLVVDVRYIQFSSPISNIYKIFISELKNRVPFSRSNPEVINGYRRIGNNDYFLKAS